jgi:hypothetical protein
MGLSGEVRHSPLPFAARVELLAYLLMPFWQGVVGVALLTAIGLAVTGAAPFWGAGSVWQLAFVYLLAFAGTIMGSISAHQQDGLPGYLRGFLIGHVYALYTWFLWPVLVRSTARQLTERRDWAKTEREPPDAAALPAPTSSR